MSSAFCSWDEAFSGPDTAIGKDKKKKSRHVPSEPTEPKEPVPAPMRSAADSAPGPSGNIGSGPGPGSGHGSRLPAQDIDVGFPLPGESADGEAWTRAFTLEPSQTAALTLQAPKWTGPAPVSGGSTLWRAQHQMQQMQQNQQNQQQVIAPAVHQTMDFTQRLDKLTKQLDSLTGVGNVTMQGTAELFLFVAIGLLLLLAIDTLLRFAVHMVSATGKRRLKGGSSSGSRWLRWKMRGLFK